jgi:FkbM family methyltransferase
MSRHSTNHLIIHHVGGRSGSRAFPVLSAFEPDLINVLYDADESCLPQVAERGKTQPSQTLVLAHCLAGRNGLCQFHINYDPYTSSIFSTNPRFAHYYYAQHPPGYDYMIGDACRTMATRELSTTTLDAVVLEREEAPAPDLLSLDTQGSELEILTGATRLLDSTILGVHVEVEFQPLYEGQPLFGDVYQFLAERQFDLAELRLFHKRCPMRGKHGFRGEGYVTDGEALFLKRPDALAGGTPREDALQLAKLAFLATVFGRFECAQQCFETPGFHRELPSTDGSTDRPPRYLVFISRLAQAVASLPRRSVPLFSDRYSYEQSQARFQPGISQRSLLRTRLAAVAPLRTAVRALRTVAGGVHRWGHGDDPAGSLVAPLARISCGGAVP